MPSDALPLLRFSTTTTTILRIRRILWFLLTFLLILILPDFCVLAGPGATDSSVATVMNLDYNTFDDSTNNNNKATATTTEFTFIETENYGVVSSPPLNLGTATSSTIQNPRPKCDKPINFDVIAKPSNLKQSVHVDPFCTKYSGGDIAVLAIEVGGGVCGYNQTTLLVQTFTDYGCNDDNKYKQNENININNVHCRKKFVWKTRQIIFVDLLSSLSSSPDDDDDPPLSSPSVAIGDKYREPVCKPTNTTKDINQSQIQWINGPIPGEIATLRIVNYTNVTTTTSTSSSSGGQQQDDEDDDDIVIAEKQLSDMDGVSFLILIRDPITGEIVLLETPKAGGDGLHKGIWFSLVVSAAVIGSGVCLCWGCCCIEHRRYIRELHENREKSKALNNNDNNDKNDNNIGENHIYNNNKKEEEDDDVEEPTQPQQQQMKQQQQKQQSDTEITFGVDTTATTTTSFVKESDSFSLKNLTTANNNDNDIGLPDDNDNDDDEGEDEDEKVSVEETA